LPENVKMPAAIVTGATGTKIKDGTTLTEARGLMNA
jgi:hypothetical protein